MEPLGSPAAEILAFLDARGIPYGFFQHEPVFTMEACLELPFVDDAVTFCKNVFLCNR